MIDFADFAKTTKDLSSLFDMKDLGGFGDLKVDRFASDIDKLDLAGLFKGKEALLGKKGDLFEKKKKKKKKKICIPETINPTVAVSLCDDAPSACSACPVDTTVIAVVDPDVSAAAPFNATVGLPEGVNFVEPIALLAPINCSIPTDPVGTPMATVVCPALDGADDQITLCFDTEPETIDGLVTVTVEETDPAAFLCDEGEGSICVSNADLLPSALIPASPGDQPGQVNCPSLDLSSPFTVGILEVQSDGPFDGFLSFPGSVGPIENFEVVSQEDDATCEVTGDLTFSCTGTASGETQEIGLCFNFPPPEEGATGNVTVTGSAPEEGFCGEGMATIPIIASQTPCINRVVANFESLGDNFIFPMDPADPVQIELLVNGIPATLAKVAIEGFTPGGADNQVRTFGTEADTNVGTGDNDLITGETCRDNSGPANLFANAPDGNCTDNPVPNFPGCDVSDDSGCVPGAFNTRCNCAPPPAGELPQGISVILQQDAGAQLPDDRTGGGTLQFQFFTTGDAPIPVRLLSATLVDVFDSSNEDLVFTGKLESDGTEVTQTYPQPQTAWGQAFTSSFAVSGIVANQELELFSIFLDDSYAVAQVEICLPDDVTFVPPTAPS